MTRHRSKFFQRLPLPHLNELLCTSLGPGIFSWRFLRLASPPHHFFVSRTRRTCRAPYLSSRPTHVSGCALNFDRIHRSIPLRPHPAIGSLSLAPMTKKRSQAQNHTAVCGLCATAQAHLLPTRTDRANTRPGSATRRHDTAATAIAVTLCIISIAAAQHVQCPAAWTTAALSVERYYLAATSLPNQGLALFAGGAMIGT